MRPRHQLHNRRREAAAAANQQCQPVNPRPQRMLRPLMPQEVAL